MPPDTNIPTPRTDAKIYTVHADHKMKGYDDSTHYFWMTKELSDFARTLERENIQLREELTTNKVQSQFVGSIRQCLEIELDFYLKLLEQNNIKFDKASIPTDSGEHYVNMLDATRQDLSAFKQCCEELLKWAKDSPHICTNKDYLEFTEAITRADALLKGENK